MNKVKIAVVGLSGRGRMYIGLLDQIENAELVAVCDKDEEKCKFISDKYNVAGYVSFDEFLSKGKIADILIVATNDQQHYACAIPAIKLGYNILLEKPISVNLHECEEIALCAKNNKVKVAVCHVLRYAPFYSLIKNLIDEGRVGDVVTVEATENVGYWHQAHTFVRGWGGNSKNCSPMILQKCCHDLDIIAWLVDKKCLKISSFGSLFYFNKEHAPEGSADYCVDCKIKDCIYNCFDYYKNFPWSFNGFSLNPDQQSVLSDKNCPYARCVFKCDNDVVDHQVVNMLFQNNITAQLTMTAFSAKCFRTIRIHGTKGEISGNMDQNLVTYIPYESGGISGLRPNKTEYHVDKSEKELSGHGGGDIRMFKDFINNVQNGTESAGLTDINFSVMSHKMAFKAEESRLAGGTTLNIENSEEEIK